MDRRTFVSSLAASAAVGTVLDPTAAWATVPKPYRWDASPPFDSGEAFMRWAIENRGENPTYLRMRWERFANMVAHGDVWDQRNKRAFLMTPREEFCLKPNLPRAYDISYLSIGWGVTISGPRVVGRMTSSLDVQQGDKVLEIGTGSGYQSAYLSNLTDKVWTVEIIKPLADRTRGFYDALIKRGYTEYEAIKTKQGDGYYGWDDAAPFDKIVVTCGIDHIPPPLLQQLKPNGVMVAPIGPPGAQHILKIKKETTPSGTITVRRSDIYNGKPIPFVPFTKLDGEAIKGTHNGGAR